MSAAKKRARPLTLRQLDALLYSLRLHGAGGPENITGYDDDASCDLQEAMGEAEVWAENERDKRMRAQERRKAGKK